jgi:hypothetical protein
VLDDDAELKPKSVADAETILSSVPSTRACEERFMTETAAAHTTRPAVAAIADPGAAPDDSGATRIPVALSDESAEVAARDGTTAIVSARADRFDPAAVAPVR